MVQTWIQDTLREIAAAWITLSTWLETDQVKALATMKDWEETIRRGTKVWQEYGESQDQNRKRKRQPNVDEPFQDRSERVQRRDDRYRSDRGKQRPSNAPKNGPCHKCGNPNGHNRTDGGCPYVDKGHPNVNLTTSKWEDSTWGKLYNQYPWKDKDGVKRRYLKFSKKLEKSPDDTYKYTDIELEGIRGDVRAAARRQQNDRRNGRYRPDRTDQDRRDRQTSNPIEYQTRQQGSRNVQERTRIQRKY